MANSTDFGSMRNGHLKSSRTGAANGTGSTAGTAKAKTSAAAAAAAATETAKVSAKADAASKKRSAKASRGVRFERLFTTHGTDPLDTVVYERRSSIITNPDGSHRLQDGGRRDPVELEPARDRHRHLQVLPQGRASTATRTQGETSVRQVVHRLAHTIRDAGEQLRRLLRDARATPTRSRPSCRYLLVNQYGAFNSPVWFNCGLWHQYGIERLGRQLGVGLGEPTPTRSSRPTNAYERPQCSACFIQSVERRPDEHLRAREERGAPLQVRLGHRHELQRHPRQAGEALGRRHVVAA